MLRKPVGILIVFCSATIAWNAAVFAAESDRSRRDTSAQERSEVPCESGTAPAVSAPEASLPGARNSVLIAQRNNRATALVTSACKDIAANQFDEAIAKLVEALQVQPGYRLALENLAVAYTNKAWVIYGQENWSAALPVLKQAIETTQLARGPQADVRKLQQCYNFCAQTLQDAKADQRIIESLGNEPDDYLADVSPVKWPTTRMPLRIFIAAGASIPSYRPEFDEQLRQACQAWTKASGDTVTFTAAKERNNSDIEVTWSSKRSEAVIATEAGHTRVFEDQSGINKATITLFTVPPPSTPQPITEDAMHVACLHELGHALGIQGHSKDPRDIMAPAFKYIRSANGVVIALSQRDCNTIARLYNPLLKSTRSTAAVATTFTPPTNRIEPTKSGAAKTVENARAAATAPLPPERTVEQEPPMPSALALSNRDRAIVLLNNEAAELLSKNQFAQALEKLFIADKMNRNNILTNSNLALTRYNWALHLSRQGLYQAAEQQIKESLRIRDSLNQQNIPAYSAALQCYIFCLQKMNRVEEAKQMETFRTSLPQR
ncbi:MAG: matrixin family metalloprotease [Candidatus Obscuribacterales bacterium]|nr:matrixin family metalloprotease [Candidatus Obscuribacterales bacterium]